MLDAGKGREESVRPGDPGANEEQRGSRSLARVPARNRTRARAGFKSVSHFSYMFRKYEGDSPLPYHQNIK